MKNWYNKNDLSFFDFQLFLLSIIPREGNWVRFSCSNSALEESLFSRNMPWFCQHIPIQPKSYQQNKAVSIWNYCLKTNHFSSYKLNNWGHTIAGVVSWSPHQKGLCGYKPGVYTRISEVRKWIKRKTHVWKCVIFLLHYMLCFQQSRISSH